MAFCTLFLSAVLLYGANCLDNGVARTPPMGFSTWNLYHRDFTSEVFYNAVDVFESSGMKSVGYEYINVDGGWWWSKNSAVTRNSTGYAYTDPVKYPSTNGTGPGGDIQKVISYIHSHGLKYGHYTDAGTNACDGDAQMSEHYRAQDIALFISWGMDMIKVDACAVKGNDTQIIFEWRNDLNATGRKVLFSDCRNQCLHDATGTKNWKPWCIDLANMWRVSSDIQPHWSNMLHNLDSTKSLGKYAQPGAWNDPDFMEIDIGDFKYDGTMKKLLMNQAHFSLWSIISAPLICGNNLTNMSTDILNILINKNAIDINQNYLNNAGDVITEFNITESFKNEYEKQVKDNDNMTELLYKPLPKSIGDAAFLFLNRGTSKSYPVSVDFNQFPFVNDHNTSLKCNAFDIWTKQTNSTTQFQAVLPPQSVKFIRLSDCVTV